MSLDKAQVEQYLSTLPKIRVLKDDDDSSEESNALTQGDYEDDYMTSRTPISDNLERMKDHSTFEDFTRIIKNEGFETPQAWASVGDEIMLAYSAYYISNPIDKDAPSLEEMKQELSEQQEKIEKNQFIMRDQKELLLNKIENSMALLNDPNYIDNPNISIIRPFIGRLNSYLRNTDDTY